MGVTVSNDTAELIASYVEAIATLLAVLLALFLQVILVRLRRPRLYVTLTTDITEEDIAIDDDNGKLNCWIRCKVWAAPRKQPARNAEVFVQRVHRPPDAANTREVPGGALMWSHQEATQVSIPAGTWRRVDLLRYWIHEPASEPTVTLGLARTADRPPWSRGHRLDEDEGVYQVDFVVAADDVDPSFWRLQYTYRRSGARPADSNILNLQIIRL
jgi:hypothetical protein